MPGQQYSEEELFRLISEGDTSAYTSIFQNYYQPLFWHALKLLKSEFWAEEIVREVFAQLWINKESLKAVTHPSAYLFKIIANKSLDRIRKQELEVKMNYFIATELLFTNSEDTSKWDEMDKWLKEAVESLPEQRKRIYQMKYQQGFSYEEIASQLSITKNTVRNQIVKALHTIRVYLTSKKIFWMIFYFF